MKAFLTAAVGAIALAGLARPAIAADMIVKAPVYKAPVADPWSGIYLGLNVGYSFGRSGTAETLYDDSVGVPLFTGAQASKMNGLIGGGQIGINKQMASWVLGLEADWQASGQKGSAAFSCGVLICNPGADTFDTDVAAGTLNQRLTWFATARVRAGLLVTPSALLYVTGGFAFGAIRSDGAYSGFTFPGAPTTAAFDTPTTKSGWTFGGGIELCLDAHWSAKIEYLRVDLGTVSTSVVNPLTGPPTHVDYSSGITDNIVRAGINYRFGNPVVASY